MKGMEGWDTRQRQTEDGAVESEQVVLLSTPVVEFSTGGAERLGRAYWQEVERITWGLVRGRRRGSSLELRLAGRGPSLLRFGPPTVEVSDELVSCRYPIVGGLLARRAAGAITSRRRVCPGPGCGRRSPACFHVSQPVKATRLDRCALQPRAEQDPRRSQQALLRTPDLRGGLVKVVVFGASGTIGTPLVRELARKHDVVGVSRSRQDSTDAVTWKTADATDTDSVARVLEGAQVVYYLVHSLGSTDFEQRDQLAAETTAREAERAGVKQLVYLGGLGDDSADLSSHLRSRQETRERLASTSVPVTTLRAAIVIGRESAAFETIVALVDRCRRWSHPSGSRHARSRSRCPTSSPTSPECAVCRRRSARALTSAARRS